MPENKERKKTYAIYDRMSTESLHTILDLEARLGNNGALDTDTIAYIAEVIARREEGDQQLPNMQKAWEAFQKNYLSNPSIGATLYCFDGDDPKMVDALCTENGAVGKRINLYGTLEDRAGPPLKRAHKKFSMFGRVVAVLVAVLLAGSITAHAFNTSLTHMVGQCFDNLFCFVMLGEAEPGSIGTRPDLPELTYDSLENALAVR